jgi:hypothetical protein
MNELELAARLRAALDASGRTVWELSRRSNVKVELVDALLKGAGSVPLRAVVRVVDGLELELQLAPTQRSGRQVGPVTTVVDEALKQLQKD